jgi:hypothetical protein
VIENTVLIESVLTKKTVLATEAGLPEERAFAELLLFSTTANAFAELLATEGVRGSIT